MSDVEIEKFKSPYYVNLLFVKAVKKRPCLYDITRGEYGKKELKLAAWLEIAKEFGCSVDECKRKWKGLRTVYKRNIHLEEIKSNKKPYYLMKHMDFIRPFTIGYHRRRPQIKSWIKPNTIKKLSECSDYDYESIPQDIYGNEEDFLSTQSMSGLGGKSNDCNNSKTMLQNNITCDRNDISKKRTGQPVIIQCMKAVKEPNATSIDSSANPDDPRRQFFLSLLPEIVEMNEKQFRTFKRRTFKIIDDVMHEPESL